MKHAEHCLWHSLDGMREDPMTSCHKTSTRIQLGPYSVSFPLAGAEAVLRKGPAFLEHCHCF